MPREILVTGGAGYIGAHVAKALSEAGFAPVAVDNLSNGHRDAVRWGPLIEADLGDAPALESIFARHRFAAIVHLAAFIEVGESMRDPLRFFRNNVGGAMNLLAASQRARVPAIVFSSTAAVYGTPEREALTEDHPTRPVNPYGESKLAVERILAWTEAAHGMRWRALRYFNAAGADASGAIGEDHRPESHLIPRACLAALGVEPELQVFGTDYPTPDGTAIRDYIHVSDLAAAHVLALERLLAGGASGPLNVGAGRGYSVAEVVRAVETASGRKVPTRTAPRRAGDATILVADISAARSALGWQPRHTDIVAIARSAWAWHVKRHGTLTKS
ncbi:MAG TPA: UDP-glucose 4-epimerase GalE [Alphaproteobacteria bacterium]|nr:UDP-glucose 4-epimerase GalE [Alphaproteobacteria bacterium]